MPTLQFKGKTAIETYQHAVPYHAFEFDEQFRFQGAEGDTELVSKVFPVVCPGSCTDYFAQSSANSCPTDANSGACCADRQASSVTSAYAPRWPEVIPQHPPHNLQQVVRQHRPFCLNPHPRFAPQ